MDRNCTAQPFEGHFFNFIVLGVGVHLFFMIGKAVISLLDGIMFWAKRQAWRTEHDPPEMSDNTVIPRKLGVKTDPPALLLVYEFWGKSRLRRFPLRHVWTTSSTDFLLNDLRTRYDILKTVSDEKISRMIDILKAIKGGSTLDEAVARFKDDKLETGSPFVQILENVTNLEQNAANVPPPVKSDKKLFEDDTDFDLHDDLPLDDLDDDDFWK